MTMLVVRSDRLEAGDIHAIATGMAADINRETDARAELPAGEIAPGARGDPITVGAIALSFVSSGAAVALFQVIRAYLDRDESLEMALERPDGNKLTIKAANLKPERINETVALARGFFAADLAAPG